MNQRNAEHALASMIELRQAMQFGDDLTKDQRDLLHACGGDLEAVTERIDQLRKDLGQ